jgi:riboflavin synthase
LFTGLIEGTGRVVRTGGGVLVVSGGVLEGAGPGESVSVDGACLTVTGSEGGEVTFHLSEETVARSVAAGYARGTTVNLERPVTAGGRFHGHLVTGHVDCTGQVKRAVPSGTDRRVDISLEEAFRDLVVEKGSVAVSGISLTVSSVEEGAFGVVLIPETLERTTAGSWKPGTRVNLEFDILGKYVLKHLGSRERESRLRAYLEE